MNSIPGPPFPVTSRRPIPSRASCDAAESSRTAEASGHDRRVLSHDAGALVPDIIDLARRLLVWPGSTEEAAPSNEPFGAGVDRLRAAMPENAQSPAAAACGPAGLPSLRS